MNNLLVTSDGTKVLTITGLRYVELQRLHEHEEWYYTERNQIILPKEAGCQVLFDWCFETPE